MPLKRERAIIPFLDSALITLVYAGRQHFSFGSIGCYISRTDHHFNRIGSEFLTYRQITGSLPTTAQGLEALIHQPTTHPIPANGRKSRIASPLILGINYIATNLFPKTMTAASKPFPQEKTENGEPLTTSPR